MTDTEQQRVQIDINRALNLLDHMQNRFYRQENVAADLKLLYSILGRHDQR